MLEHERKTVTELYGSELLGWLNFCQALLFCCTTFLSVCATFGEKKLSGFHPEPSVTEELSVNPSLSAGCQGCDDYNHHFPASEHTQANSSLQRSVQRTERTLIKINCFTVGGEGKKKQVLRETGWITRLFEEVTISICLHVLSAKTGRKQYPAVTFHLRNVGVPEEKNKEVVAGRQRWEEEGVKRTRLCGYPFLTSPLSLRIYNL